jgi:hypothetical protein
LSSRRSTGTPSGAAGDRESAWAGSTRSVIAAFPSRLTASNDRRSGQDRKDSAAPFSNGPPAPPGAWETAQRLGCGRMCVITGSARV